MLCAPPPAPAEPTPGPLLVPCHRVLRGGQCDWVAINGGVLLSKKALLGPMSRRCLTLVRYFGFSASVNKANALRPARLGRNMAAIGPVPAAAGGGLTSLELQAYAYAGAGNVRGMAIQCDSPRGALFQASDAAIIFAASDRSILQ